MAIEKVMSEITGKVWKIEAGAGQRLAQEEAIIILESMKMEIPVLAPVNGVLKEILVKEGDSVTEGQVLAVMES